AGGFLEAGLERGEAVGAARDQRARGALARQHLGEAQPEPARGAGDQRDPAPEIEQFRCAHAALDFGPSGEDTRHGRRNNALKLPWPTTTSMTTTAPSCRRRSCACARWRRC